MVCKDNFAALQACVQERLANYAHDAWSGWMCYLFEKSVDNTDGTVTIPKWAVDRWKRQLSTSYTSLPEAEKVSDRKEADKMIRIVLEEIRSQYKTSAAYLPLD